MSDHNEPDPNAVAIIKLAEDYRKGRVEFSAVVRGVFEHMNIPVTEPQIDEIYRLVR